MLVAGKYRCDKEIGSVKAGWHSCNKIAVHHCESSVHQHAFLFHICKDHLAAFLGEPLIVGASRRLVKTVEESCPPS